MIYNIFRVTFVKSLRVDRPYRFNASSLLCEPIFGRAPTKKPRTLVSLSTPPSLSNLNTNVDDIAKPVNTVIYYVIIYHARCIITIKRYRFENAMRGGRKRPPPHTHTHK